MSTGDGRVVLAADVGGGSIRVARVDGEGTILERRSEATPQDPEAGMARLAALFEALGPADGRAVVVAGAVHPATGTLLQSPNLKPWEGLRIGERLDAVVLNDANGAALGEFWRGALEAHDTAVLLTLGTGVGGGLVLDGEVWTGATGVAGEVGHLTVDPAGPPCPCGSTGCLEVYASATAVVEASGARHGREAAERARRGEARAKGAFDRAARMLGIAMAGLANVLNPEAFCIGGGLTETFDLLEDGIWAQVRTRAFRDAQSELRVLPARLAGDAGLLGAAHAALRRLERAH